MAMVAVEDNNEQEGRRVRRRSQFDIRITRNHEYFSRNFEEISSYTIYDEKDTEVELAIIYMHDGVMPVPGSTVPLILFQSGLSDYIFLEENHVFGLVNTIGTDLGETPIGVTAEIVAYAPTDRSNEGEEPVEDIRINYRLKVICRQRFILSDSRRLQNGLVFGKAKIMPDVMMPSISSFLRGNSTRAISSNVAIRRRFETVVSAMPPWIYDQYNVPVLVNNIKKEYHSLGLLSLRESESIGLNIDPALLNNGAGYAPEDINLFSYWMIQSVPITDEQKYDLMRFNTPVQRFQWITKFLQGFQFLKCRHCQQNVSEKKSMFCMSVDGPITTFVNPSGHVFEILTTQHMIPGKSYYDTDEFSEECSWYPGYGWRNVFCNTCFRGLGWQFRAVRNALIPATFFALQRNTVVANNHHSHIIFEDVIFGPTPFSPSILDVETEGEEEAGE